MIQISSEERACPRHEGVTVPEPFQLSEAKDTSKARRDPQGLGVYHQRVKLQHSISRSFEGLRLTRTRHPGTPPGHLRVLVLLVEDCTFTPQTNETHNRGLSLSSLLLQ